MSRAIQRKFKHIVRIDFHGTEFELKIKCTKKMYDEPYPGVSFIEFFMFRFMPTSYI